MTGWSQAPLVGDLLSRMPGCCDAAGRREGYLERKAWCWVIASQSYVEESLCFRGNGLLGSSSSTPLETSMLLLLRRLLLARLQSSSTTTGVSLSRTHSNHRGPGALPPPLGVSDTLPPFANMNARNCLPLGSHLLLHP